MIDFSLQTVYNKSKRGDFMSQSMINFRMDSDLKKRMEETCKKMGLTMTAAFTIYATNVTNEQRIPFEITADPFYSQANMEELEKRFHDIKPGKTALKEHELIEV